MAKIRVGIVGFGRSGRDIHAAALLKQPSKYQIVAVTDPLKQRRDRAARELGCDAYRDDHRLFQHDDIDLIINASPSHLHVPISLEILRAGFNCVCEKPLAQRVKDVDKITAAARKAGKMFTVFQQSRYAPYFLKVREVIDSGVLGRIVQINISFSGFGRRYDWQSLQEFMGGSLLNTGPHPLDQALQLFGTDTMPKVTCHMDCATTVGDAEDHVLLSLAGKGRPQINVEISSCCSFPNPLYKIYGTQGGLQASLREVNWRYFLPRENPKPRLIRKPLCHSDGTPAYPSESIKWISRKWSVPKSQSDLFSAISNRYYKMVHATLTKNAPLEITLPQIRQQAAVIEECQKQNPHIYDRRK